MRPFESGPGDQVRLDRQLRLCVSLLLAQLSLQLP